MRKELEEIANTILNNSHLKPNYSNRDFMNAMIIFQSAIMCELPTHARGEGRASRYKSSNLAQCLLEVQMFNKPLMPCFCKTLVMGNCFSGTQNLAK